MLKILPEQKYYARSKTPIYLASIEIYITNETYFTYKEHNISLLTLNM